MKTIRIAQFGLGPIGLETLKLAATRPWIEIVGGVDVNPALAGQSLGVLTGLSSLRGAPVVPAVSDLAERPDLIFHTAVSKLADAAAQILPLAALGISIVSSCEELLFPAFRNAHLARQLDEAAKSGGARILGTGVNPGFVMDLLPLCLTGVCRSVEAVHVQRVVNASTRRGPLQKKIGSGLPPAEFERLFRLGQAGHAGLKDSAALLAHGLGWELESLVETGAAVAADHDIATAHVTVKKGQTCGLHQRAEGVVRGRTCLTLDLKMYLDAPDPHDACQIAGEPPLDLRLEGGVAGDTATIAALVNAAPRLLSAPPGLRLMTDIALPKFAGAFSGET